MGPILGDGVIVDEGKTEGEGTPCCTQPTANKMANKANEIINGFFAPTPFASIQYIAVK
mgnify:CR=1 FL=1